MFTHLSLFMQIWIPLIHRHLHITVTVVQHLYLQRVLLHVRRGLHLITRRSKLYVGVLDVKAHTDGRNVSVAPMSHNTVFQRCTIAITTRSAYGKCLLHLVAICFLFFFKEHKLILYYILHVGICSFR